ncbi:P-loop containing nucleoside triphosphate hydrolase protein [Usnea florida]
MKLAEKVERWLRSGFASVKLKQTIPCRDEFQSSRDIKFITVADLTTHADYESIMDVRLPEVDINLAVFELHGDEEQIEPSETTRLRIAHDTHDISFSSRQNPLGMPDLSSVVLLHGPPGNGKTSLCRALAQQLSIRLSDAYPSCKLVEFDAHLMFSEYYGESGKVVDKAFAVIEAMLDEDENTFICVLIDDIESLAGKRECYSSSNEPHDSLRAVNALLTAIDRLRCRPNVTVFCTSNLIKAVDPAFLDRIDIKQHIPSPSPRGRYEILRFCYLELARRGIIAPVRRPTETTTLEQCAQDMLDGEEVELVSGWASPTPSSSSSAADKFYTPSSSPPREPCPTKPFEPQAEFHVLDDRDLPPYALMMLHFSPDEKSLPRTLWEIATKSANLSARSLRRLPAVSLAMYTRQDPCTIDEAFRALAQAVDEEMLRDQSNGAAETEIGDTC